jgi:hypothetical protein
MINFDANVCNGYAKGQIYSADRPCGDKSMLSRGLTVTALPILASRLQV